MVTLPPGSCKGPAGASHRETGGCRGECRIKCSEPQARCSFWNLTVTVCSLLPRITQVQLAGELRLSRPRGLCKVPCTSKSTAGGASQAEFRKGIRSGRARAPPRRRRRKGRADSILGRTGVPAGSRGAARLPGRKLRAGSGLHSPGTTQARGARAGRAAERNRGDASCQLQS